MTKTEVVTAVCNPRKQMAVVEYHFVMGGPEWHVMLPDGEVKVVDRADVAFKLVQKAAKRGNKGVTLTTVEWRNVPEGFKPPSS